MRENYTLPRLYLEADLSADASVDLPKDQAHYLGTVIRKHAGDFVRVFNGRDGEWRAEIKTASKRAVTLNVIEQLRAPYVVPDITLAFAPVRKHRTAFIIEKATELGVKTLQPVITARTQFSKFNADKARLQAIEAAEQTERMDVPVIAPSMGLNDYVGGWNIKMPLIFADEALADDAADRPSTMNILREIQAPAAILIGPEGGFTEAERDMLRAQDFVRPVSLGPRILRADTAAVALLTLFQSIRGDWD